MVLEVAVAVSKVVREAEVVEVLLPVEVAIAVIGAIVTAAVWKSHLYSGTVSTPHWYYARMLSHFSRVRLFVTLWTVARQALLSTGILQAKILEWVARPSSRGSSQPRDRIQVSYVSCIGR